MDLKPTSVEFNSGGIDFVQLFPPELSNTLFSYSSDRDLFSCCKCSVSWRNVINNDQQWSKRCLVRGWTTKATLNEAHNWEDLSHMQKTNAVSLRPTPEFTLKQAEGRLYPLCEWALYFRKRLHVLKNWSQGIYTVHKLIVPEAETESLIMNCAACTSQYFVFGTTLGFVFIWNVTGVSKVIQSIEPVTRNLEVEHVYITSNNHLVLLYEKGLVRVFHEVEKASLDTAPPFQIIYQAKVLYNFSDETRKYLQEDELDFYDEITEEGVLFAVNDETILLTAQNCQCFIIWDLECGQNHRVHFLPSSCLVYQVLISNSMCIFSVLQASEDLLLPKKYGIVMFDLREKFHPKMEPVAEVISPKIVDELSDQCTLQRFAFCSQEGVVGAFDMLQKTLLFLRETDLSTDNLATSEDLIFYHESEDRLIIALSWSGETHYRIAAHIGPVKSIRCFGSFMISGGAVRELHIWEKLSGKKLHTVYHQPNHILDLFVSPTRILTVGRDEPPAMIGYL
ncbi:F-box/WD repeat-containing protein pof11 [Orchesella cincta]|uniref:F-box/WD repeat-containing protein pof11 n=1 Tax=Orchesella cincta TaxID=48709 RepID=A0A1D2M7A3_ORCCI|nr:F-box/WD repeat-containing protein pof11 [Orchesella cincta]